MGHFQPAESFHAATGSRTGTEILFHFVRIFAGEQMIERHAGSVESNPGQGRSGRAGRRHGQDGVRPAQRFVRLGSSAGDDPPPPRSRMHGTPSQPQVDVVRLDVAMDDFEVRCRTAVALTGAMPRRTEIGLAGFVAGIRRLWGGTGVPGHQVITGCCDARWAPPAALEKPAIPPATRFSSATPP